MKMAQSHVVECVHKSWIMLKKQEIVHTKLSDPPMDYGDTAMGLIIALGCLGWLIGKKLILPLV